MRARPTFQCLRARPTVRWLSASSAGGCAPLSATLRGFEPGVMLSSEELNAHVAESWQHWQRLGAPKFHVAPMVDQSELPFRLLCRRHGATAAYTPMLHARLFSEGATYRSEHLTTCAEDRPLFVQFCANDPDTLLTAAKLVDDGRCDYVDLNLGCPQRIAKRGHYGSFLMDDLPRVQALVCKLKKELKTPVSAKIRIFSDAAKTVDYARMLQAAGASLVAVHGRTRDQKDCSQVRANWDAIRAVKHALFVPVLGNGDVRTVADAHRLMEYTGVDGVLSAGPLLEDPHLFDPKRLDTCPFSFWQRFDIAREYLDLVEQHPVPMRMIRGHMHKFLNPWFHQHVDLRDRFVSNHKLTLAACREMVSQLEAAAREAGRDEPIAVLSERKRARLERDAAMEAAKAEQDREAHALQQLRASRADAVENGSEGRDAGGEADGKGALQCATQVDAELGGNDKGVMRSSAKGEAASGLNTGGVATPTAVSLGMVSPQCPGEQEAGARKGVGVQGTGQGRRALDGSTDQAAGCNGTLDSRESELSVSRKQPRTALGDAPL